MLWDGYNFGEVLKFVGDACDLQGSHHDPDLVIHTLEGDHHASVGDWIIRGVKGEFYPCKPDIFEQTYTETNSEPGRTVATIDAKSRHEAIVALEILLDEVKRCAPNEHIHRNATAFNEGD